MFFEEETLLTSRTIPRQQAVENRVHEKIKTYNVCTTIPPAGQTGIFVIDLSCVYKEDMSCDDSGPYISHFCNTTTLLVPATGNRSMYVKKRKLTALEARQLSVEDRCRLIFLKRQYSYRESKSNHSRQIITCMDAKSDGQAGRYGIIQYTGNIVPHTPHGNSKGKEPYIRTKLSVIKKVKQMGKSMSAKRVIHALDRDAGGAVSLSSPSDVLRDRQQAYNIFRHIDGKIKSRYTSPSKYMHIHCIEACMDIFNAVHIPNIAVCLTRSKVEMM